MGNTLLQTANNKKANPLKSFEDYLIRTPELMNKEIFFENKLFKTYQFSLKNESSIIIKVYLKRDVIDLSNYERSFMKYHTKIPPHRFPNLLPFRKLINFDKNDEEFVAVARQFSHTTLQDKFHSISGMNSLTRLWILTQTIIGLYSLHNEGLYHGDLKTSNILLTTNNHVFLSDFAVYKPYFILDDQLGEFRNFYANFTRNSSVLKCLLAPEKFVIKGEKDERFLKYDDIAHLPNNLIKELQIMDIFSLGCLITETFLDGKCLFTFEQLQSFRKNEYDPKEKIMQIPNENIRNLVLNLVEKEPSKRKTIKEVLIFWFEKIIQGLNFDFLFYIDASLMNRSFILPDYRIALISHLLPAIYTQFLDADETPSHYENLPLPLQSIKILQNFFEVCDEIEPNLITLFNKKKEELFFIKDFGEKNNNNDKSEEIQNSLNLKKKSLNEVINSFQKYRNGI